MGFVVCTDAYRVKVLLVLYKLGMASVAANALNLPFLEECLRLAFNEVCARNDFNIGHLLVTVDVRVSNPAGTDNTNLELF